MKTKILIAVSFSLFIVHSSSGQGRLTPPGAPAPVMKSLDQIQPRTAISSAPFAITNAGSYYLTTNLVATAGNGITISANNVTLDLNGFALLGVPGTGSGVSLGAVTNIFIRNGTLSGWGSSGIDGGFVQDVNVTVEHLTVSQCGWVGIFLSKQGVIRDCLVFSNLWGAGFHDGGGVLSGIVARNNLNEGFFQYADGVCDNCTAINNGGNGFYLAGGALNRCMADGNAGDGVYSSGPIQISSCSALNNGGRGFNLSGNAAVTDCTASNNTNHNISAGANSTVAHCTANGSKTGSGIVVSLSSTVDDCTAIGNNQYGIDSQQRSSVKNCTANYNSASGIHATYGGSVQDCFCMDNSFCGIFSDAGGVINIVNNTCHENGKSGTNSGAGIRVMIASLSRIEGNTVSLNYSGLDVLSPRNIVIHNMAALNSNTNFNIVSGNSYGPVINVAATNDLSGVVGANNPTANFSY